VVTFNMAGLAEVAARLPRLLAVSAPDLLAIQECAPEVVPELFAAGGYRVHRSLSTCLVSRWPIASVAEQPSETIRDAGGSGYVTRYRIDGPVGSFDLTNVHLDTPRDGFEAMLRGDSNGPSLIKRGILLREIESRRARRWADQGAGPRLVAGDFNTPEESAIFRTYWGDLTEAFDRAGVGFGFTRYNGWIQVRIDHVLSDSGFQVVRAEVLPDYGSDHRPLMADLVLISP
jgi:endonuclease/exonuclease/phosphatase (EEP) superfamily protein YafD